MLVLLIRPVRSRLPVLLAATLMLLPWIWAAPASGGAPMAKAEVIIGGQVIRVDIADTPALQTKGLGGRRHLGKHEGMLFVYAEKSFHQFWMRGMFIPIDIIWLDNRRVVHIEHDVPPPAPGTDIGDLTTYTSGEPANLVLELAAGQARALGLKVGERVQFRFDVR